MLQDFATCGKKDGSKWHLRPVQFQWLFQFKINRKWKVLKSFLVTDVRIFTMSKEILDFFHLWCVSGTSPICFLSRSVFCPGLFTVWLGLIFATKISKVWFIFDQSKCREWIIIDAYRNLFLFFDVVNMSKYLLICFVYYCNYQQFPNVFIFADRKQIFPNFSPM